MGDQQSSKHEGIWDWWSSRASLGQSWSSVLLLMLVPAPYSPSPACTGWQEMWPALAKHNLSCTSSPEMQPLEESISPSWVRRHWNPPPPWWGRGASLNGASQSPVRRETLLYLTLHWLQEGSDTSWVFNSETCLTQITQKCTYCGQLSAQSPLMEYCWSHAQLGWF